jgi:hypothetical protein
MVKKYKARIDKYGLVTFLPVMYCVLLTPQTETQCLIAVLGVHFTRTSEIIRKNNFAP